MYLKEIYLENTGPISKCHIELPFNEENPLPVVVVGPNGSGKSIFLSYIVDALTEFARVSFYAHAFFRTVNQHAIRSGEQFSLSLLCFETTDGESCYCEKVGTLDPSNYPPDFKSRFDSVWDCLDGEDDKKVSIDKDIVNSEIEENVHAFFPARRYENPDWLYNTSLEAGLTSSMTMSNLRLDKPLLIETCASENISWILDVFLDSFINPELAPEVPRALDPEMQLSPSSSPKILELRERYTLGVTRQNVESILQTILQDKNAELSLNLRDAVPSRLAIQLSNGQRIPNLQSLSEGQSQLFHLFATIIRYGERADINMSTRLDEITGLVVIDEIDTHLHTALQHDIVPQLIKLFPKVQFIVSSHSPLFLLGMEETFAADGFAIIELPEGTLISSERFTEFGNAFEFYQNTERFEEEIKQRFADMTKPVVLTEGKTDAKYIQTALQLLGEETLLNSLEIQPVGVEGPQGWKDGGKDGLNRVKTFYKKDPSLRDRMLLLLYDWDTPQTEEPDGKIWVKSISQNPDDPDNKSGIENLFPGDLFEDRFYDEEPKKGVHGRNKIEPKFKKNDFCDWICEERRNPADFEKFKEVVEILREFLEAHQSHSLEQATTE
ncbi:MAG: AAA family ATPase [Candidatus Poribacteria bacterium]|nr:AAA family ATPase [Candidatus Poribacteria bacterium]